MENDRLDLRVKKSYAGLGLFTFSSIRRGQTIIEYVGRRVPTNRGDELRNRYIFNVNSRWDIDGSPRWNTARYINHSCRPNCEAVERRGRIFIVAKKKIEAGEELTYHYGKDYFDEYIKPYGCRCVKCSG
jgi:SET domain-containing protein